MTPTLDMSRKELTIADTSLKIWQTIAETSLKIWHQRTQRSRLVQRTWATDTRYRPSNLIKKSRRPRVKTPQPSDNGNGRTVLRNKETSGPRRAPSLLWETTS